MHLSVDSRKPIEALRVDLRAALSTGGLAIASESDSSQAVAASRPARSRASFVIEVADPLPSLPLDAASAAASTWKIAGYEMPGGMTRLSTMRPTQLVDLLGHPHLANEAARLEKTLETALKSAAGWEEPNATS